MVKTCVALRPASPEGRAGGARGGEPSRYVLAACFDGHRGPRAAQYASAALPDAVRRAVERGEPSPLAAAWRAIADGYLETGHQDGACATMALIAMYFGMVLTNWGTTEWTGGDDDDASSPEAGRVAMWLNISAQWVMFGLYIWTLVAPIVCPDRDFA